MDFFFPLFMKLYEEVCLLVSRFFSSAISISGDSVVYQVDQLRAWGSII